MSPSSQVLTIEGADAVAKTGDVTLQKVQQAWIDSQVPQCGYCQPGMMMVAAGSIKAGHHGNEIGPDMTHICVCGTYPRIKTAIQKL